MMIIKLPSIVPFLGEVIVAKDVSAEENFAFALRRGKWVKIEWKCDLLLRGKD